MLKVEAAVKEVFGSLSIRDEISMQKFSDLTLQVRMKVEGATDAERKAGRWLEFLLPPKDQEDFVLKESGMTTESSSTAASGNTPLRRLLDETSDLIDSPPFSHVLTLLLDAGFSTLVERKVSEQAFKIPPTSDVPDLNAPRITEIVDVKPVRLPAVLAILSRQAHSIGNGVPNEYLQSMEQVRDLEAFAAVVYSSNWESEISPMNEESSALFAQEDGPAGPEIVAADSGSKAGTGQESIVDVGAASAFESAWGKAVDHGAEPVSS